MASQRRVLLRNCVIISHTLKPQFCRFPSTSQTLNAAECAYLHEGQGEGEIFVDPRGRNRVAEGHQRGVQSAAPNLRLVLLGGPGVGKGTYGDLLSRTFGFPHISTGDLIRAELAKTGGQSRRRELLRVAVDNGDLVPDGIIAELLEQHIPDTCHKSGYVLDGFPRTLPQAKLLEEMLPSHLAVHLTAAQEALVAKSLGRRRCGQCGRGFNMSHVVGPGLYLPARFPPAECAGKMTWRSDDADEAVVRQRLRLYEAESVDLVEYYRSEGKLLDLDVGVGVTLAWPRLLEHIHKLLIKTKDQSANYQDYHHHKTTHLNHFSKKDWLPNGFYHHSYPPHFHSPHCRPMYSSFQPAKF